VIRTAADVERGIELEIGQEVETEDEKCANDKKRNGTGLPFPFLAIRFGEANRGRSLLKLRQRVG